MVRAMSARLSERLLGLILPVDAETRLRALLGLCLFGLLMGSFYLFKPVRDSLYIHYVGAENLAYIYLASVAVALGVAWLYNRAFAHIPVVHLLPRTVLVLVANALVFWGAYASSILSLGLLSTIFFLWVTVYGTLVSTLFWSLANDVFPLATWTPDLRGTWYRRDSRRRGRFLDDGASDRSRPYHGTATPLGGAGARCNAPVNQRIATLQR